MTKSNKILILFLGITLSLFFSNCKTSKTTTLEKTLTGIWEGEAHQFNINESWNIKLQHNNKSEYKISYPSLGCGGTWTLQQTDNKRLIFVEEITFGKDICTNNGRIVLDLKNNNEVDFYYYWPTENTLNAKGTLHRKK